MVLGAGIRFIDRIHNERCCLQPMGLTVQCHTVRPMGRPTEVHVVPATHGSDSAVSHRQTRGSANDRKYVASDPWVCQVVGPMGHTWYTITMSVRPLGRKLFRFMPTKMLLNNVVV